MEQAVRIAFEVAHGMAKKLRVEPGELVGAAWEGAAKAEREMNAGPGMASIVARQHAVDEMRRIKRRLKKKNRPVSLATKGDDRDGLYDVPDRRSDPCQRIRELWCETEPQRRSWHLRTRLMLYLYIVEELDMGEISDVLEISRMTVSNWLRHLGQGTEFVACSQQRAVTSERKAASCRKNGMKRTNK